MQNNGVHRQHYHHFTGRAAEMALAATDFDEMDPLAPDRLEKERVLQTQERRNSKRGLLPSIFTNRRDGVPRVIKFDDDDNDNDDDEQERKLPPLDSRAILARAHGLPHSDFREAPFNQHRRLCTPTQRQLYQEFRRRLAMFETKPTKKERALLPNSKSNQDALTAWLANNPVRDETEIRQLERLLSQLRRRVEEAPSVPRHRPPRPTQPGGGGGQGEGTAEQAEDNSNTNNDNTTAAANNSDNNNNNAQPSPLATESSQPNRRDVAADTNNADDANARQADTGQAAQDEDLSERALLTRALGLPGCDFRQNPFCQFGSMYAPTKEQLFVEVKRRFGILGIDLKTNERTLHPSVGTKKDGLVRWLIQHPIPDNHPEVGGLLVRLEHLRTRLQAQPAPWAPQNNDSDDESVFDTIDADPPLFVGTGPSPDGTGTRTSKQEISQRNAANERTDDDSTDAILQPPKAKHKTSSSVSDSVKEAAEKYFKVDVSSDNNGGDAVDVKSLCSSVMSPRPQSENSRMNLPDPALQVHPYGEGNDVSQSGDASASDPVFPRKKPPPKRPPAAALPVHRCVASAAAASTTASAVARLDSSASTVEAPVDPAERASLLLAQRLAAADAAATTTATANVEPPTGPEDDQKPAAVDARTLMAQGLKKSKKKGNNGNNQKMPVQSSRPSDDVPSVKVTENNTDSTMVDTNHCQGNNDDGTPTREDAHAMISNDDSEFLKPKDLMTRALGLPGCNFQHEPFKSYPRDCKPTKQQLYSEVKRRCGLFGIDLRTGGDRSLVPTRHTLKKDLVLWLIGNPIPNDHTEVGGLLFQVESLRMVLEPGNNGDSEDFVIPEEEQEPSQPIGRDPADENDSDRENSRQDDENEWKSLPSLNWSDKSDYSSMFGTGEAQSIDALGSGTEPEPSVQQTGGETSGSETKSHTDKDKKTSSNSGNVSMADSTLVEEATSLIDGPLTVLSVSSHSETSPVLGGRDLVDGIFESNRSTPLVQEAASLIDGALPVLSVSSQSETSPVLGGRELVEGIIESNRSTSSHKSGETSFVVSFGSTRSPTTQVSPLDPTSKSSSTSSSRLTALSKDLLRLRGGRGPPDAQKDKGGETTRLMGIKEEEWSEVESMSALSGAFTAQVSIMDDNGPGGGLQEAREKLVGSRGGEKLRGSTAPEEMPWTDRTVGEQEKHCQQTVTDEKAQSTPLQENGGLLDKRDPEKIRRHLWNLSEMSDVSGLVNIMQQHIQESAIQEEACAALRNVALDGDEARQKIGEAGGVGVVLSAIEQHARVEAVQREAIGALSILAKDSSFNRRLIAESNGISLLLRAMHQHHTIATIQEKSADALSKMAIESIYCASIVAEEGITIILKAMEEHLSEADVQASACCALSRLALKNKTSRTSIAESYGISAVVRAMERHDSVSAVQQWGCCALAQLSIRADNMTKIAESNGISAIVVAMGALRSVASVQEQGCLALCNLSCNDENERLIGKVGGITAVAWSMKEFGSVAGVEHSGMGALANLCYNGDENCKLTAAADGISLVVEGMTQHASDKHIQAHGCRVLGLIARNGEIAKSIASSGGIHMVAKAMKRHKDAAVQQCACFALERLTWSVKENREMVVKAGGIELVVEAMRKYRRVSRVQQYGCFALGNLAEDYHANRLLIWKANGTTTILRAMQLHPSDAKVQRGACWALAVLAKNNEENQQTIVDGNGISLIVDAMQHHPSVAIVQEKACFALWDMAANDARRRLVADGGGISVIVRAMEHHAQDAGVQESGCGALANLACWNVENKKQIGASGGISVVVGAMQRHKDHAGVQQNACLALANLTTTVVENKKMVAKAGGVALIVDAMQQHPSEPFLQHCGCLAFGNVAYDYDVNKPLIVEQDGITVVLRAMQLHPLEAKVQWIACFALEVLARNNEEIQELIVGSDGVSRIVDAMERHETDGRVQESACWALDRLTTHWTKDESVGQRVRATMTRAHQNFHHQRPFA